MDYFEAHAMRTQHLVPRIQIAITEESFTFSDFGRVSYDYSFEI